MYLDKDIILRDTGQMAIRRTTVAGSLINVRLCGARKTAPDGKRTKKNKPTAEAVMKINRKNAERDLILKLNHNFKPGDMHVVLTYGGEAPSKEEAKKTFSNFLKRLRRRFKKQGRVLKWIAATEYKNKRIHHHLVMSQMDTYELDQIWTAGKARPTHLDSSGDYRKLASYLIKETDKTFRDPDAYSRQRFSCSRTIVTPDAKVQEVSAAQLLRDPKPIKGYYIDQDSIYRGRNPFTGAVVLEYYMVSAAPVPRLSIWPRGKREKNKARYHKPGSAEEYQTRFIMPWEEEP